MTKITEVYSTRRNRTSRPFLYEPFTKLATFRVGLLLVGWGWWRIRFKWYGVKTFVLGICSFLIGVILWVYSIPALFDWSTQF